MTDGPNLEGSIVINTRSVQQAQQSIRDLEKNLQNSFGRGSQSIVRLNKSLNEQRRQYAQLTQSLSTLSQSEQQAEQQRQRANNLIAQAANKVAQFESAVRRSNVSQNRQNELIQSAASQLAGYESAVSSGATGGQNLENVNTQLNVSMGQLKRSLTNATDAQRQKEREEQQAIKTTQQQEKAQAQQQRSLGQANAQYESVTASIRRSGMEEQKKAEITRQVEQAHRQLTSTLQNNQASVSQVAAAQRRYKEAISQANVATRNANATMRGQNAQNFASEMRNLTGSVQVALGPLSGVASRLTALQGLFTRNAASLATLFASITALSVGFQQSASYAQEMEREMAQIEATLDTLGDQAQVTANDINMLSRSLAADTLMNQSEVRQASSVLLQFGGIARNQFEGVIESAQGMASVFGGSVTQNVRRLGRTIEDPVSGLSRLEQAGVQLEDSIKDQIVTLAEQGRSYQATNVLLKEMESLQKAAKDESETLAGAYDSISDNLDVLFEQLFKGSGALENMTESVNSVADAIADFADSDEILAIGHLFSRAATIVGAGASFMLENLNHIIAIVISLAASKIPALIAVLFRLSQTMYANVVSSLTAARASINGLSAASVKASVSVAGLGTAVKVALGPIGAIASAIGAATLAYKSMDSAVQNARDSMGTAGQQAKEVLEDILGLNMDLTREQVSKLEDQIGNIAGKMDDAVSRQERHTEAAERTTEEVRRQARQLPAVRGALNDMNVSSAQNANNFELLTAAIEAGETELANSVRELIQFEKLLHQSTGEVRTLESEIEKLKEKIEEMEGNQALENEMQIYEAFQKRLQDLRGEYQRNAVEIEELERQIATFTQSLTEAMLAGNATVEEIKQSAAVLREMEEALEDAKGGTDGYSSAVQSLEDDLRSANEEMLNQQSILQRQGDISHIQDLNNDMREVRQTISELSEGELKDLTQILDSVSEDASPEQIAQAYEQYRREIAETTWQLEDMVEAQDKLDKHFNDQSVGLKALQNEYAELRTAAMMSGDFERMDMLDKELEKERAAMDEHSNEIVQKSFDAFGPQTIAQQMEQRREALAEVWGRESEEYQNHLEKMKENEKKANLFQTIAHSAQGAEQVLGESMQAMQAAGKEQTREYQAMAAAQAVIAQGLAVSQAWADSSAMTFEQKVAQSAAAAIAVGSQIAQINSASYSTGGHVQGPGTSTSDSIPANLSDGEFVMNANAVKKLGLTNMHRMNQGQKPMNLAKGGSVGSSGSHGGGSGDSGTVVQVIDQRSGDKAPIEREESFDAEGRKVFRMIVRDTVKDMMGRGELDRDMTSNYHTRRKPKKR